MSQVLQDMAESFGSMLGSLSRRWNQATCSHDDHWVHDRNKSKTAPMLRCAKCGRPTAMLDLRDIKPPRRRFDADPARLRLVRDI